MKGHVHFTHACHILVSFAIMEYLFFYNSYHTFLSWFNKAQSGAASVDRPFSVFIIFKGNGRIVCINGLAVLFVFFFSFFFFLFLLFFVLFFCWSRALWISSCPSFLGKLILSFPHLLQYFLVFDCLSVCLSVYLSVCLSV